MTRLRLFVPASVQALISSRPDLDVRPLPASDGFPRWPRPADLSLSDDNASRIAVTWNNTPQDIVALVESLTDIPETATSAIVYCDEPIPASLLAGLPECMHPFLRRLQPADLLFLRQVDSVSWPSNESLSDAVLRYVPVCKAMNRASSLDRFPDVGPGHSTVEFKNVPGLISRLLSSVNVKSAEQRCLNSGLLLLWDFLDESHEISQTMEGKGSPRTADYWHGIMHRREPDPGNAAYWFRRVGHHPAFATLGSNLNNLMSELKATPEMHDLAKGLLVNRTTFNPFAMIELSTAAIQSPTSAQDLSCRMVQYLEILNLLASSTSHA